MAQKRTKTQKQLEKAARRERQQRHYKARFYSDDVPNVRVIETFGPCRLDEARSVANNWRLVVKSEWERSSKEPKPIEVNYTLYEVERRVTATEVREYLTRVQAFKPEK